jgi:hypothetical protein
LRIRGEISILYPKIIFGTLVKWYGLWLLRKILKIAVSFHKLLFETEVKTANHWLKKCQPILSKRCTNF